MRFIKLITVLTVGVTLLALNAAPAVASPYLTFHRAETYLREFDEEIVEHTAGQSFRYLDDTYGNCHRITRSRIGCWEVDVIWNQNTEHHEWECTNRVYVQLDRRNVIHLGFHGGNCEPIGTE